MVIFSIILIFSSIVGDDTRILDKQLLIIPIGLSKLAFNEEIIVFLLLRNISSLNFPFVMSFKHFFINLIINYSMAESQAKIKILFIFLYSKMQCFSHFMMQNSCSFFT